MNDDEEAEQTELDAKILNKTEQLYELRLKFMFLSFINWLNIHEDILNL